MHLTPRESRLFSIGPARNGQGIFARVPFKKEETLFQVRGQMLTCDEDDDIEDEIRNNTFRYDKDWYISPQGLIADMLNHSCAPNAKVVKRGRKLFVVALRSIGKGREVLIDYSTIVAADDVWTMRCNCGASTCRKVVRSFPKLPPILQARYRKQGAVPPYIF